MKKHLIDLQQLILCSFSGNSNIASAIFYLILNLLSRISDSVTDKPSGITLYLKKQKKLYASYQQWIKLDHTFQERVSFSFRPLISIIIPTYNPDPTHFRSCINSVMNQQYDNWEICISDDNSQISKRHIDYIKALNNPKIRFTVRKTNGHISLNSNGALELATGDFVLLLDQDDELNKSCLAVFVKALNENPEADFLYADEDLITDNKRHSPAFKPDFSIHTLLSRNYITHPVLIKTRLIKSIHGFRKGYEGSQDHDLFLRLSKVAKHIVHVPRVLYHWRVHTKSTSKDISQKSYIAESSVRAIKDYLENTNIKVNSASVRYPNYYRIGSKKNRSTELEIFKISDSGVILSDNGTALSIPNCLISTEKQYILFLGQDIELPDTETLSEAVNILDTTSANSIGGALIFKNKMIPSVFYLQNHHLQTFYAYKKSPFTGYHGFGLAMTNADAVNPCFWFVKKDFLKAMPETKDLNTDFFTSALAFFSSSISRSTPETVFIPYFTANAGSKAVRQAEYIYTLFSKNIFFSTHSKCKSKYIGLTKGGFYFQPRDD